MSITRTHRRVLPAVAIGLAAALTISACAETEAPTEGGNQPIKVGTTDVLTHLDPAGAYDNGSSQVMNQVYPFLIPRSAHPMSNLILLNQPNSPAPKSSPSR